MQIQKEKVQTGDFVVPGLGGGDNMDTSDMTSREGVSGLTPDLDFVPWTSVLCIKVTELAAEWILKDYCECPAGQALSKGTTDVVNLDCDTCNMFGVKPGHVVVIPHPNNDKDMTNWYLRLEEILQFWARQSGRRRRLANKAPVFNLDVPRVVFTAPTVRDSVSEEHKASMTSYKQGQTTKSFAYWDEYQMERLIDQLKQEGDYETIDRIKKTSPAQLAKPVKEVKYGRYDSIFS